MADDKWVIELLSKAIEPLNHQNYIVWKQKLYIKSAIWAFSIQPKIHKIWNGDKL